MFVFSTPRCTRACLAFPGNAPAAFFKVSWEIERVRKKALPEVRWGGPEVAQRRQGRSRGACGARDGSGLVLMGPRHATGGHMCHGPGRPSGVNSARNRPLEPHMPAHGPTNEPLSTLLVPTDYPDPLKPAPLRRSPPPAPPSSKPRSFRSWRDREFDGLPCVMTPKLPRSAIARSHPAPCSGHSSTGRRGGHLQCEHTANRPKMMGTRRWPVVALRLELHLVDVATRSQVS